MTIYDVIIAGAGTAGLFCAANLTGLKVLVLEKMPSPAKKLLISGSGQCNITHSGRISDFASHYGANGQFLKPALSAFSNTNTLSFFEEEGIKFFENPDGKIFPESKKASDILDALLDICRRSGTEIICSSPVSSAKKVGELFEVNAGGKIYTSRSLVIACGGKSYPKTGSDGDGYRLAASFGHTIADLKPALTPVYIRDFRLSELAGIAMENVNVSIWKNGKKSASCIRDLLITPHGFSGPAVLDISRSIDAGDTLKINFAGMTFEELDKIIKDRVVSDKNKAVENILYGLSVPERLCREMTYLSGISKDVTASHLSADCRKKLVRNLTEYPCVIEHVGDFSIAMCTAGGVSLDDVSRKTFESKIVKGLYFAGEVLDIDGDTGGYNIQAAFSSAYAVSVSISGINRN